MGWVITGWLALSCAGPQPGGAPSQPAVAAPDPAHAEPEESPEIGGPRYRPSSNSDQTLPIASNAYGAYQGAPDAPEIGDIAQPFSLPTIDGGTFDLEQALGAGPVLIMFYRGFW